ncbi:hypothetical protein K32_38600 [Kaistia sp. 32K]|uniref:DUF1937 family protein n=1 Tax=Kaistia sp. 32K TaxID=2795690 RepID=UPI001915C776|nr:DUF1937 family protein [Kaistia sp. 32K]BCP55243.1 hypothetical protein K32_38600 [Kaistia sp. 32K]
MRKIFLACPYGHSDAEVIEARFAKSNEVAAVIARSGNAVFSQVSMSHPINKTMTQLDRAAIGELWAPIDRVFMEAMTEIIVIDMDGWRESSGIAREMKFFEERGLPVNIWSNVQGQFRS